MLCCSDSSRRLGSRRLGGPVEFKNLWPALRDELHEAYMARDGLAHPDAGQTPSRAGNGIRSMKVSEKGAASVYGLGRFPVTLYQEQWSKLLDLAADIRGFIKDHEGQLKKKE